MPLTSKGQEILANMKKEYGAEKGESVFYASANAGKIKGVHDGGDLMEDIKAQRDYVHIPNTLREVQDRLDTMWKRTGDPSSMIDEQGEIDPEVAAAKKEIEKRQLVKEIERMKQLHESGNSLAAGRLEELTGRTELLDLEISTLRNPRSMEDMAKDIAPKHWDKMTANQRLDLLAAGEQYQVFSGYLAVEPWDKLPKRLQKLLEAAGVTK